MTESKTSNPVVDEPTRSAPAQGVHELDWSIEPSRCGVATLQLGRRNVHSRYDPEREAESTARSISNDMEQARANLLIIVGSGLGYIVRALVDVLVSDRRRGPDILVYEPFPEVQHAIARHDPSIPLCLSGEANASSHLRVVHTPEAFEAALGRLRTDTARPHLTVHPGYEDIARFEVRHILACMRRRYRTGQRRSFDQVAITGRDFRVLRRLSFRPTIDSLVGTLRGQTAIIASGGPSLDAAIPALANHPGGVLFACPQALQRLARAGIRPNYVVSPDPQDLFALSGAPEDAPFDTLLLDTQSHPGMAKRFLDRVTHFHLRAPSLASLACKAMGMATIDEPFITVSETSVWLAHFMGARRFVLAGVDLDSDDPRYHNRFHTRNLHGEIVETNSHYFHAARYLDDHCAREASADCEFFRLGSGLPIRGCRSIEARELEELLRPLPRHETAPSTNCMTQDRLLALRGLTADLERELRKTQWTARQVAAPEPSEDTRDLVPLPRSTAQRECEALRDWLDLRIERFEVARRKAEAKVDLTKPSAPAT